MTRQVASRKARPARRTVPSSSRPTAVPTDARKPRGRAQQTRKRHPVHPASSDSSDYDSTLSDAPCPVDIPTWAQQLDVSGAPLESESEEPAVMSEPPLFDLSVKCTLGLLAAYAIRAVVRLF